MAAEASVSDNDDNNNGKQRNYSGSARHQVLMGKKVTRVSVVLFVGIVVVCLVLFNSASPSGLLPSYSSSYFPFGSSSRYNSLEKDMIKLERVLKSASMEDKTIILTTLNRAWAEPDSMLDLFMRSFREGNKTEGLLKHLVIITLDKKAHARCLAVHPHCYELSTEGGNFSNEAFFMTSEYLEMLWRRIRFLGSVLRLGYNFVFTDVDIMWLRDPFPRFHKYADFQISCDNFTGDSKDLNNIANGGFNFVRSNYRTIQFYKFWYNSRNLHPGKHDQEVFNEIKNDPLVSRIGIQIRYLDTAYFGGFCSPDDDLNLVCTMHANCCIGQESKIHDLKILLQDWKYYMSLSPTEKVESPPSWSVPLECRGRD